MIPFKGIKLMIKGTEQKKTQKGKDYTNIIVLGDDNRTIDLYFPGVLSVLPDKFYLVDLVYKSGSYGSSLSVEKVNEFVAAK